jgi:MarR family transcriptional regulator, organic hydroperoxide resistance regulator
MVEEVPITAYHGFVATAAGRDAWRLFHEIFFAGGMRNRLQEAGAAIGVSPGLLKVLFFLEPDEAVRMGDLAEHLSCDASYVTNLADALEERGLAERHPHPTDRRVKTLVLSEAGVAAKQQLFDLLYQPPPEFDVLSAAEQRELRDLLRKVAGAVHPGAEAVVHGRLR